MEGRLSVSFSVGGKYGSAATRWLNENHNGGGRGEYDDKQR